MLQKFLEVILMNLKIYKIGQKWINSPSQNFVNFHEIL